MSHSTVSGVFGTLNIPNQALADYREGKNLVAEQKFVPAAEAFTKSLAFDDLPPVFAARAFEQRGVCYWLLGDYDKAETDFIIGLEIGEDRTLVARIQARLGDVADSRGQYEQATEFYLAALKMGNEAGDLLSIGRSQRGLGIVSRRQGNAEKALSHLTQALLAFRQAGDALEQARVLTSLGRTRHSRGEYQQAISMYAESLNIVEALNDRWRIILSLNDLGECYQALYDMEKALQYHRRALQSAEEHVTGENIIMPDIQRNLGVDLVELGQVDEGMNYLKTALNAAREMGNREQEGLILYHLTRAYLGQEALAEARASLAELIEVAEALDADRFRALAAFIRGELLFAEGDRAAAAAELNTAILDAQTSLDRGILWKLHAAISHVVDNEDIAKIHAQIAADFIQQTVEPLQDIHLKRSFVNAAPVMAVLVAADIDPEKLLREA